MPHYVRSNDSAAFAAAVASAAAHGEPSEEDLFITRAVLYTASTRPVHGTVTSLARAKDVLARYPEAAGHAVPATPLIHFLELLLEALEKRSHVLVDVLLGKYESSLDRDPSLEELTQKCSDMWAPKPVAPGGGLFGDLFRSMLMPGGA